MPPIPVPHRWLATILGVAFLLDAVLTVEVDGPQSVRTLASLPGSAAIALCAYLALSRPALGAALGAVSLLSSTALILLADTPVPAIGLDNIALTELVAGTALTTLVVWRAVPAVAAVGTTGLVVACLVSMVVRETVICPDFYCYPASATFFLSPSGDLARSGAFGLLLLLGAIGAGLYLRRAGSRRVESEMSALVRKQWPLAAAIAVLGLVELSDGGTGGLISVLSGGIAGACAFFAPKYPLRNALIAAAAIALVPILTGGSGRDGMAFSFTNLAAAMALVAYLVRYEGRREATWGTIALVVGTGVGLAARSPSYVTEFSTLLVLLFLLGIAIATGWYFRARDRERNQTVRAAVTSAQQSERMALARELHDVVAHHVTGIVVQAQAALLVAENNPGAALVALEKIEHSGAAALTAMRTLVGGLRDGTAGDATTGEATTDLRADLVALVENFVGPPVQLDLDVPAELPHEVGRSVLRLVQESLTNVGKHAPDARDVRVRVATVEVAGEQDHLHIRVVDDGARRPVVPVGGSGGYGLIGMRERVELLGGRFEAGPNGYVGWSVEAWLPLPGRRGNEG